MPTLGSAFSGIGGLDRAMEELGFTVRWQIENDGYCNKILTRHWPEVKRYGDIRGIDPTSLERVDAICAGFPCQPWSVAGQNRGESDDRNLWPATIRLIRGVRPRYVFLENVPGLVAHGYFGTILGDLAAGGYDAEWGCFTAAQVGASHRRDRLFILAYSRYAEQSGRLGATRSGEGKPCGESTSQGGVLAYAERTGLGQMEQSTDGPRKAGEPVGSLNDVADTTLQRQRERRDTQRPKSWGNERVQLSGGSGRFLRFPPGPNDLDAWARVLAEVPTLEPAVCKLADGLPDRVAALRALGNAVVKAQAVHAFRELWARMEEA